MTFSTSITLKLSGVSYIKHDCRFIMLQYFGQQFVAGSKFIINCYELYGNLIIILRNYDSCDIMFYWHCISLLQPSFQSLFSCWSKDWLIKHGMTSQKADALLFRVGEVTANVSFHVKLAQHFFIEKLAQVRTVQVRSRHGLGQVRFW